MEEPGKVIAVRGDRVEVEIEPGPACDRCGASGFCQWTGRRSRLVLARNEAGAQAGEMVLVETVEAGRFGSAGLVFGVLGGAMAAGVVVGTLLWGNAGAAVLAGVGLALGFAGLKLVDRRKVRSGRGLPAATRVLGPEEARACRPGGGV